MLKGPVKNIVHTFLNKCQARVRAQGQHQQLSTGKPLTSSSLRPWKCILKGLSKNLQRANVSISKALTTVLRPWLNNHDAGPRVVHRRSCPKKQLRTKVSHYIMWKTLCLAWTNLSVMCLPFVLWSTTSCVWFMRMVLASCWKTVSPPETAKHLFADCDFIVVSWKMMFF